MKNLLSNKTPQAIYGGDVLGGSVVPGKLGAFLFLKRKAKGRNQTADEFEIPEKWYQKRWCREQGGRIEVVLPDKTRCDCVTDTHAIEFDFGSGWAEAIGQSAYYSIHTQKKAGIVLILETMKDRKYWIRLNTTIEHFNLPIDIWSIGNAEY